MLALVNDLQHSFIVARRVREKSCAPFSTTGQSSYISYQRLTQLMEASAEVELYFVGMWMAIFSIAQSSISRQERHRLQEPSDCLCGSWSG